MPAQRSKSPNQVLAALLDGHQMSRKGLAHRVNQLARAASMQTAYTHTSVARWLSGQTPQDPVPTFIAVALADRIGRPVTVEEIGMCTSPEGTRPGWDFPRDRNEAIAGVLRHFSGADADAAVGTFTPASYVLPVTRWLAVPADTPEPGTGGRRIGPADLTELRDAAEQARAWDARFGGGDWRMSSVTGCLRDRALPMLAGTHPEPVARQLFGITAELARVVGWAAFDAGRSTTAQQHLIQALRLARAGGDVETGAYVLATMALHAVGEGMPDQAVDMAQGAFQQGKANHAARRVLAFAKLAEARALGRLGEATAAASALSRAERLLDKINSGTRDPEWISYVTHSRLAADAAEIFRDLRNPAAALRWSHQATDRAEDGHTRAVGLRQAVVATAACQTRDLELALDHAGQALDILERVTSARAEKYLRDVDAALAAFGADARVAELRRRLQTRISGDVREAVL